MKKIAAVIAAVLSVNAFGSEPIKVGGSLNGDALYVYPDSIVMKGNMRSAWVLASYVQSPFPDGLVHSIKYNDAYDCSTKTMYRGAAAFYSEINGRGTVLGQIDATKKPEAIIPGTVFDDVYNVLCSLK